MWQLRMMPFSVEDARITMWKDSLKQLSSYGWAVVKDGEWNVTQKGQIALKVLTTKYNGEKDAKAAELRDILQGHKVHPGKNDGYNTWPFEKLVRYAGFYEAMKIAIDYNASIHQTVCGQDFLILYKTHVLFESPDESFKCPVRGPYAGKMDGVHYREWEIQQEAKGYSVANGKINRKNLIE